MLYKGIFLSVYTRNIKRSEEISFPPSVIDIIFLCQSLHLTLSPLRNSKPKHQVVQIRVLPFSDFAFSVSLYH